jgi:hypothetical protein
MCRYGSCRRWSHSSARDTALAQLFCHMTSAKKDDVWTQFYPLLDK